MVVIRGLVGEIRGLMVPKGRSYLQILRKDGRDLVLIKLIRIVLILLILIIRGRVSNYISDYIIVCSDDITLGVVTVVGISTKLIDCSFTIDSPSFLGHLSWLDCLASMQGFHLKGLMATPNSMIIVKDKKAIFAVPTLSLKFFCSLMVEWRLVDLWNINFVSIDNRWISSSFIDRWARTLQRAVWDWKKVDSIHIRISHSSETASSNWLLVIEAT